MKSEYKHQVDFAKRYLLTQSSRWVVAVQNKKDGTGGSLLNNDTSGDVSHTTGAWSLREGLPPLDLVTIKDFLRFVVSVSDGTIDEGQKRVTVDSLNTCAEWFFAGFARVTGNPIDEEDRTAVYHISTFRIGV